jgi:hypothetical protein
VLIHSILRLDERVEEMWPEFIRLLFVHADERHEIDSEAFQDTTTQMGELLGKLGG